MVESNIRITIKTVPHTNPAQAIDVFAKIVVKELLANEKEAKPT